MLQLFVRGVGFFHAERDSTVGELALRAGAESVYYGGRLLDPCSKVGGIPNNATLDASRRLRGGMNPFKVLGDLFKLIGGMIKIVFKIVTLVTKPAQCIMLIIAFIIVSILFVVYFVLTLPPFIYILVACWYFGLKVVPMIVYCVIFAVILIVIFVLCLVMAAINVMTGGALRNIVLCDSLPSAWHNIPNYHLTNKWERGLMCTMPCPKRYAPTDSGLMCEVIPKGYPPYCPQAEAMRIFTRKKSDRKYMFNKFNENINVKYLLKTPNEREDMLKDYYIKRKTFNDKCSASMSEYDNISLTVCAAADSLNGIIDDRQIKKLKAVCAQAYCTQQRNYPFCSKTSDLNDNDANAVIKKVVKIVMIIITLVLAITLAMTFMYNNVDA